MAHKLHREFLSKEGKHLQGWDHIFLKIEHHLLHQCCLHDCHTLQIIHLTYLRCITPQSKHASLNAHSLQLGTIEVISGASQLLKVNICADIHLPWMDLQHVRSVGISKSQDRKWATCNQSVWQCAYLENSSPCLLCGVRELNFPIKTAWAHKCRVQYVCSVCGCYNLLATCLSSEICQFLTRIAHCHSILLSTCHLVNKAWKNM